MKYIIRGMVVCALACILALNPIQATASLTEPWIGYWTSYEFTDGETGIIFNNIDLPYYTDNTTSGVTCEGIDCYDTLWKSDETNVAGYPDMFTMTDDGNDSDFTIQYNADPEAALYFLIAKDGSNLPTNYIFDISVFDWGVGDTLRIYNLGNDPSKWALSSARVCGVVPIPAAAWIFGAGLVGLVGIRRKFSS